eukprot:373229-Pelagomonas_calceolata.AAC.2
MASATALTLVKAGLGRFKLRLSILKQPTCLWAGVGQPRERLNGLRHSLHVVERGGAPALCQLVCLDHLGPHGLQQLLEG